MFYENVKSLCQDRRTNITTLMKELGMSTSMPTSWKNGAAPKADTIKKIADYFGVTTDYLLRDASSVDISGVQNSVVLQGNRGNNQVNNGGTTLTDQEQEVLRIFRSLDMRKKTAAMSHLYDLEDGGKRED